MISLCGELGSIDSQLSPEQKHALKLFFANIGLVFQIVDDILDVEGDEEQLGKPVGSDSENNKSTFITL
jgi:geranylgeranyl diphosphate synthase type II